MIIAVVVVAIFSVFNISGALLPLSCRHEDRKVDRERRRGVRERGGGEFGGKGDDEEARVSFKDILKDSIR